MEPSRNEIEEATANFRLEQIRRKIDKQSIKQRQLERNSNTQKLERQRIFEQKRYGTTNEADESKENSIDMQQGRPSIRNDHEHNEEEKETNQPESKNYWVRRGYAIKLLLRQPLLELPESCPSQYTINSKPEGEVVLVYTANGRTRARNKNGFILKEFVSEIPGGSPSTESSRSMVQCIYYEREQVFYMTDLLIWDDDLRLDDPAEVRYFFLISKILERPQLTVYNSENNEFPFRVLNYLDCSCANLERLYYGAYLDYLKEKTKTGFAFEELIQMNKQIGSFVEKIVNYVTNTHLIELLNIQDCSQITENVFKRMCMGIGFDFHGNLYLKDGISFTYKVAAYRFGYNDHYTIWKDSIISPYCIRVNKDLNDGESEGILYLNYKYHLETSNDQKLVSFSAEEAERMGLEKRRNYRVGFRTAGESPEPWISDWRIIGTSSRMLADCWKVIMAQYCARNNPFTLMQVLTQLRVQENEVQAEIAGNTGQ